MSSWRISVGLVALTLGALPRAGSAQRAAPGLAAVRGYVFDSLLTSSTLPGARVFLSGPTTRMVVANDRGRFSTDSLQPGQYVISFSHPSWDEVGYAPPDRTFDLKAGVVTPLFLSSTAGEGIFARLCPTTREDRTGVVLGQLTNVATTKPIAGAEVRVEWSESQVSKAFGVSRRLRALRAVTDSVGRYTICGVPNDAPILFRARAGGLEGPPLELDLKERTIAVRMLTLDLGSGPPAEPAPGSPVARRGTAVLKGTVKSDDGAPITDAQILVLGLDGGGRSTGSGAFQLDSLPGGTHTIEVRAIGFSRRRQMVNLRPDQPVEVAIRLTAVAVVLPEVEVKVAARRSEFDQRRLTMGGSGHFITAEEVTRRNPLRTEELFRGVPGFSVVPSGGFGFTVVSTRGPGVSGLCSPQFYVDGVKTQVDADIGAGVPVNPGEIYGIESYSSAINTPPEYQSQSECGTVLIWTKRGGARRRP